MKSVKFKSRRDTQNITGVVKLLKCGRKGIVWNYPNHNLLQTEMWKIISYLNTLLKCGCKNRSIDWNVEENISSTNWNVEDNFYIGKHSWNMCNLSEEDICSILQGMKNYWNVEEKGKHGTIFKP